MTTSTTTARKAAAAATAAPPEPALPESGTPAPPTVHEAWSAVMGAVQGVSKAQRNVAQNFSFRGIDDVMNAVGPALREHGVAVLPRHTTVESEERIATKTGTAMHSVIIRIGWRIYGPGGDWIEGESLGESADAGDKAVSKAHSVAYRTFLLQALCIPTDQPDPDHTTFTAVTGAPTTTSAGETLTMDGRAGYDRLKEIAKIPDQSDRIKAVAEWTDKAQALGVMEEKVLHGGRLRTLASVATELSSNASQTLGSTDA